ncbi:peptidoglycan-binding protein [Nonomuraea sp. NPDC059023]|uniref:C40 family peptidase n=1 Tax=unclassified Nonomuraea TaxID=2593643 RepID=UPI00369E0587
MSLTVEEFLDTLKSFKGYREQPDKDTTFGLWWDSRHRTHGFRDAAWCDMFLAYCAFKAGGEQGLDIIGEYAYTPYHAGWFARHGAFGNRPTKGAVVFFDWAGTRSISAIDHVGVVLGTDNRGRVVTIEGNTEDAVKIRYRDRRYIVGYGYPKYAKVSVKPRPDDQPGKPTKPTRPTKPSTGNQAPRFPLTAGQVYGIGHRTGTAKADKDAIRRLQAKLADRGWAITADGVFGPITRQVVRAFQDEKGLAVDGLVGPRTWAAIWDAPVTA